MRYHAMGQLPPKRHVQFRDPAASNGHAPLLSEEVMGYEGFSGNESILYHLQTPCRVAEVGEFTPRVLEEWVPAAHVHRLTHTTPLEPEGDPVSGRRVLMFNNDVEIGICKPAEQLDAFYRNGEGDEVLFVHEGSGELETIFGRLLVEEVMGYEGFSGNESILYHLQSPCRVAKLDGFEPIERKEWLPDQHAHRHFHTKDVDAGGDEVTGRRVLMWNDDVEISLCRPKESMDYFFRNGEGDEVIFVHEGGGVLETIFGDVPYTAGDYVVVPRGTTT